MTVIVLFEEDGSRTKDRLGGGEREGVMAVCVSFGSFRFVDSFEKKGVQVLWKCSE